MCNFSVENVEIEQKQLLIRWYQTKLIKYHDMRFQIETND